ncbi:MAG: GatB/YqeY domain-containing protein [Steroidobacterales bacterium]
MSLKARIQEDMKAAMRSGDKDRLGCIRLIMAAVKQREVDERITLDDPQLIGVLEKMGKQRRESIAHFQAGGRADLVAKENAELDIINAYLPAPLAGAELDALINAAIGETGAASIKDMGKVMALIKSKAQGRADMSAVGARIKARLS